MAESMQLMCISFISTLKQKSSEHSVQKILGIAYLRILFTYFTYYVCQNGVWGLPGVLEGVPGVPSKKMEYSFILCNKTPKSRILSDEGPWDKILPNVILGLICVSILALDLKKFEKPCITDV